jgi:hypothetical protein
MKPQMYNINAFDANSPQTFHFIWQGNQAFGNILQIRDNNTNTIIYEEPEITMQLKYPLSPNVLKNGGYYNARIAVIDIDGNVSDFSDPILFYCFTTPIFIFDNIEENQIVKNSSYQINMSYSQIENEPLQNWEISLYDNSRNVIQTSGAYYTDNIVYTLTNLEDNQTYYIKALCTTLNGMHVETEYIYFSVNYEQPSVYSLLVLENLPNNGYIKIQSNIRAVEAKSLKEVEYIDGEYANLKDNTVYIDEDFSLEDDFIINLLGYDLTPNTLIMQLSDGNNNINLYLRNGIYDINNNIEKTFLELTIPISFTHYVSYSNYIDNPLQKDMIDIWVKRKNGLYGVYITNKGGE